MKNLGTPGKTGRVGRYVIALVEFILKFTSNNAFQLFLNVLYKLCALKRSPGLNWH